MVPLGASLGIVVVVTVVMVSSICDKVSIDSGDTIGEYVESSFMDTGDCPGWIMQKIRVAVSHKCET
jgi:hypothetical protein